MRSDGKLRTAEKKFCSVASEILQSSEICRPLQKYSVVVLGGLRGFLESQSGPCDFS